MERAERREKREERRERRRERREKREKRLEGAQVVSIGKWALGGEKWAGGRARWAAFGPSARSPPRHRQRRAGSEGLRGSLYARILIERASASDVRDGLGLSKGLELDARARVHVRPRRRRREDAMCGRAAQVTEESGEGSSHGSPPLLSGGGVQGGCLRGQAEGRYTPHTHPGLLPDSGFRYTT